MKMRRYWAGIAFLAMAMTGCAVQEMEAPVPVDATFEVFASPAETKTANDGMSTLWVEGDRFDLFHAKAGTTAYVSDGAFTVDDPGTGHALGSVGTLPEGKVDWYMVYPYSGTADSPEEVSVVIGSEQGGQVQQGAGSTAHLAGAGFPLGGRALGVDASETPVLAVNPILSVLAVHVTNPGARDVKVETVRFKAPEAVTGLFQVDVTGTAPVYTAVDASDEAVLNVTGQAVLKAGDTGVFYLGIKPFRASSGSSLTLSVNDEERTVVLTREVTFSAGRIKTLNVTLDETEPDPGKEYYFKRVTSVVSGHKYILVAEDTKTGTLRKACALPEGTDSGRMEAEDVTDEDGIITLRSKADAMTIREVESNFMIRQADGRYIYNGNSDNVFVSADPASGQYWALSFGDGGVAQFTNGGRRIQYNPTSTVRKFQIRTTSSSGASPWLYELQNDDDALEEFLAKTVPGVYDFGGLDWLYADGTSQISVRTSSSSIAFRIFQPVDYRVVQVTGVPADVSEGDVFDVRLVRYVKQSVTDSGDFTVTAAKVEDGKAWLMSENGTTGFIVCIQ